MHTFLSDDDNDEEAFLSDSARDFPRVSSRAPWKDASSTVKGKVEELGVKWVTI